MTRAEAQHSHSSQLLQRKRLLSAAGFQGHLKNTTRQSRELHFQFMPGNRSPLSLCILTLPSFHTTAKSIEMTTQLEGHSQADWAVCWNACWLAAQGTSGKTNNTSSQSSCLPAPIQTSLRKDQSCHNSSSLFDMSTCKMELSNAVLHWDLWQRILISLRTPSSSAACLFTNAQCSLCKQFQKEVHVVD